MADDQHVELTIVMPCLNEAETLAVCIRKALAFLSENNINGEVLIGDNGSTDGSLDIAASLGTKVINVSEKGYGAALMGAIRQAKGEYIIMGDSDDSYDFKNLGPFLAKLRSGYDLVMGNRFKGGIKKGAMPFLHRYLGNPVLSFIGRLFFNIPIGDFHCGLRGFRRDAILRINLMTTGMEFASEMIVKAALFNLKIDEVPIILSPDGRSRPPHLRTWRDGWRHLRFLLLYSPRWLFLYPGITGLFIATAFFILTFVGPLVFNQVVLDIHSMVYFSTMITMSVQIILFYIMSKIYAINQGLIPVSRSYNNYFNYFTLERGLICGIAFMLAGFAFMIVLLKHWKGVGFGPIISTSETLRLAITSSLLFIIGGQIAFSSFVFSILGIIRKEQIL